MRTAPSPLAPLPERGDSHPACRWRKGEKAKFVLQNRPLQRNVMCASVSEIVKSLAIRISLWKLGIEGGLPSLRSLLRSASSGLLYVPISIVAERWDSAEGDVTREEAAGPALTPRGRLQTWGEGVILRPTELVAF